MINARTVNLSHIASQFSGAALVASSYRRLQRFFQHTSFDGDWLALVVARLMRTNTPRYLALDRTNWKIGKKNVNILMLAVLTRRTRIPLMWMMLDKRGGSSTAERIALMDRYLRLFGAGSIKLLLCDREFIGQDWIAFLQKQDIPFVVRVRKSALVQFEDGTLYPLGSLLHKPGGYARLKVLPGRFAAMADWGLPALGFAAKRLANGEPLIVVSNMDPVKALADYRKRWQIECLFGDSKTRGLNLEDTRLTNPKKLNTLLTAMTLAMAWAYACARESHGNKTVKTKTHGYRYKSWFRIGFDQLRKWLLHRPDKAADIWNKQFPRRLSKQKMPGVV